MRELTRERMCVPACWLLGCLLGCLLAGPACWLLKLYPLLPARRCGANVPHELEKHPAAQDPDTMEYRKKNPRIVEAKK